MTDGTANTPTKFFEVANEFGFTFNWAYASRTSTAYFSSGLLPRRANGLDRRLPTLGTGDYEWRGFLNGAQHPRSVSGPGGLLLNWNNQSAPGFMHGDDAPFGSVHRVELFDKFPAKVALADDVSVMNRAATEDARSLVWPVVSQVLRGGAAPNPIDARALDVLDAWVQQDAPRLDADQNGKNDDAGAPIMDAVWRPIAEAVMRPVYGDLLGALDRLRGLGGLAGESYVDKDLRTLLDPRRGQRQVPAAVLRQRVTRRVPGVVVGRVRCRAAAARRRAGSGSGGVARQRVAVGLRARPHPRHVPRHEPPDLPAGASSSRTRGSDRRFDDGTGEEVRVRAGPQRDRVVEGERAEAGEIEVPALDQLPRFARARARSRARPSGRCRSRTSRGAARPTGCGRGRTPSRQRIVGLAAEEVPTGEDVDDVVGAADARLGELVDHVVADDRLRQHRRDRRRAGRRDRASGLRRARANSCVRAAPRSSAAGSYCADRVAVALLPVAEDVAEQGAPPRPRRPRGTRSAAAGSASGRRRRTATAR